MGRILGAYIVPHPPIIVPEVGNGREKDAQKTIDSMIKISKEIKELRPSTIIVVTPHGHNFIDYLYVITKKEIKGDLTRFGCSVSIIKENNLELVDSIIKYSKEKDIDSGGLEQSIKQEYRIYDVIDHGALVPLYYIDREYKEFRIVHISMSFLGNDILYDFGKCIANAVENSKDDVIIVSSGDLSHRLSDTSGYGFHPKGIEFDNLIRKSVEKFDPLTLISIDDKFCDEAGQCGLKSFIIMYGMLDRYNVSTKIHSYEAPYGIGYMVAGMKVVGLAKGKNIIESYNKAMKLKVDVHRCDENEYVSLARKTLEHYVKTGEILKLDFDLCEEMKSNKAGIFVSIKKSGTLRGCIGTIYPIRENIALEIVNNAISAGTKDPRFDPVREDELYLLVYSVDVLKAPEKINSINELDVKKYGLIVRSAYKSGLLLPNLDGINTPEEQLKHTLAKAGISEKEDYTMERFEVVRYK